MEKEIPIEIAKDLKTLNKFKKIYENILPVWSSVPEFPAIGIVYDSDVRKTHNNSKVIVEATIPIYIYNKQKTSDYSDNLSDLVDEVVKVINNNKFLKCNTIEATIVSFKRDGGLLMPFSIAQLILSVKYISII